MKKTALFFILIFITSTLFAQATWYNVRTYGARGDGQTLDTKAINQAIDAASAAGGGTVYFPAGNYLSISIHLKSKITLRLEQGCTLIAADTGYDEPEPNPAGGNYQDFGHSHWHNSLIWGENLEDVSIIGPGKIYGKGLTRSSFPKAGQGNKAIALKLCRSVMLKDFTLLYGGHFGLLATGVDHLTIDNVMMDTNRDGMDIDCCQNVRIANCAVNSPWDDGICLKSSYALGYNRACENITITNCNVSGFDRGTFADGTYQRKEAHLVPDHEGPTGRIKFGTESNGGFKNIAISNCTFQFCRGLALETVDGASLEDITITNITMRDVVNSPIFLRLGARMRGPAGTPVGSLKRVIISNLMVYNADSHFSSLITGIPGHDIEDVQLNNIRIYYRPLDSAASKIQQVVPEHEKLYPEPEKFGVLPAYGFFIRHAKNIKLNNVEVSYLTTEPRPPFIFNDVKGIILNEVKAQVPAGQPMYKLNKVSGFEILPERWLNKNLIEEVK
ncbi:glycoside hydrolase family 28 protein [Mucilaginibacter sp. PAMB04274]|uniref:rhamnogalacturonidase n=1 Tax=Mucilaginibacter sp. PAMB04274 TaxID=3138568 RepID=UPI0031F7041E